ncbi:MAG: arginine--tRNA ligase [Gemmatimonadetes bacterium]|nr:arginine--tRNA ligase [Gemmatimonadota bacterium]
MTDVRSAPARALAEALREAAIAIGAPDDFSPQVERPADPTHGDFASNAALVLSGRLGRPPRELAAELAEHLDLASTGVSDLAIAGPGFLNFSLSEDVLWAGLRSALESGPDWGRSSAAEPLRYNVEFVSANPTGPLHVAHGRGAAIGDATAALLEWTGHEVKREFYVNDAGRQIELLGESIETRWLQARGADLEMPQGGYQGEYIRDIAEELAGELGDARLEALERPERLNLLRARATDILRAGQARDLDAFGVDMDHWFDESSLFATGGVDGLLDRLTESGRAYRDDGAVWLRTTDLGDEKDRVLVKSDGSHTYFVSDIAYHLDKAERGFQRAIDVWGADHHGHVPRMQAALTALGLGEDFLEVLLIQLVTVMRGGEEVRMSKRAGQFVSLRDLFAETGPDVARYFFLMRRAEVPMAFDLDLALDTSDANPVYKVQYAHARMCSVFRRGEVDPESLAPTDADLAALGPGTERMVLMTVLRFPERVRAAARARAPYQICNYLEELAGAVNAWYHEGNLDASRRLLAEGPSRPGRLALARAVQLTLGSGLKLLGISAPERLEREGE